MEGVDDKTSKKKWDSDNTGNNLKVKDDVAGEYNLTFGMGGKKVKKR